MITILTFIDFQNSSELLEVKMGTGNEGNSDENESNQQSVENDEVFI